MSKIDEYSIKKGTIILKPFKLRRPLSQIDPPKSLLNAEERDLLAAEDSARIPEDIRVQQYQAFKVKECQKLNPPRNFNCKRQNSFCRLGCVCSSLTLKGFAYEKTANPEEQEFKVSEILAEKSINGVRYFLIKFKGFHRSEWTPYYNLNCKEKVKKFKRQLKNSQLSKDKDIDIQDIIDQESPYVHFKISLNTRPQGFDLEMPKSILKRPRVRFDPREILLKAQYGPFEKIKNINDPAGLLKVPFGHERTECDCTLSNEEISKGVKGCTTKKCLNFAEKIECGLGECPLEMNCGNNQMTLQIFVQLELFIKKRGGIGVRPLDPIKKGALVNEYTGRLISAESLKHSQKFTMKCGDHFIDATKCGNHTAFISHDSDPNCVAVQLIVQGEIKLGIFAKRDISEKEELTLDYEAYSQREEDRGIFVGDESMEADNAIKNTYLIASIEKNDCINNSIVVYQALKNTNRKEYGQHFKEGIGRILKNSSVTVEKGFNKAITSKSLQSEEFPIEMDVTIEPLTENANGILHQESESEAAPHCINKQQLDTNTILPNDPKSAEKSANHIQKNDKSMQTDERDEQKQELEIPYHINSEMSMENQSEDVQMDTLEDNSNQPIQNLTQLNISEPSFNFLIQANTDETETNAISLIRILSRDDLLGFINETNEEMFTAIRDVVLKRIQNEYTQIVQAASQDSRKTNSDERENSSANGINAGTTQLQSSNYTFDEQTENAPEIVTSNIQRKSKGNKKSVEPENDSEEQINIIKPIAVAELIKRHKKGKKRSAPILKVPVQHEVITIDSGDEEKTTKLSTEPQ